MKKLTTILFFMTLCCLVQSQYEPVIIKGIIKDKQTQDFIPFAHVILGNKVTISNINGEFSIPIENPTQKLELTISYLGFETYTEKIENYQKYYEVFIAPSTTQLQDVTVRSGPQIMRRAFNNFHLNYVMEPQQLEGYYKESMKDSVSYCYVTEGIMEIYTPSNLDKYKTPIVSPKRSRKKIYKQVDEEDFLSGNASDMAHSSIWRPNSFLSKKNRKNYDYYYDGVSQIGNHTILVVDFEPKNRRGKTSGRLYIDDITYAILRIEYAPNTSRSNFWDKVSWTEEYELNKGSFQLVSVAYDGVASQGQKNYSAVLVVNDASVQYELPSDAQFIGIDDSFIEEANYENTKVAFWEGFHAIKLNDRVAAQIKNVNYDY